MRSWIGPVSYVLVALAAFGCYIYSLRLTVDFKDLNSLPYVKDNCKVLPGIGAAEDLVVDPTTGLVYIAHASVMGRRTKFFPAANNYNKNFEPEHFLQSISVMDPDTQEITALEFEGFEGHDYISHGINVVPSSDANAKFTYVSVINHERTGSVVTIFKHAHGSNVLQYLHEFKSPKIRSPNSVTAIGPNEIYVTNDHYFPKGFLRIVEFLLMPIASTNVVHCTYNPQTSKTQCESAVDGLAMANGIEYLPARDEIVVTESTTGRVTFFPRLSGTKASGKLDTVHKRVTNIGTALDNVRIVPGTSDVIVAAFPDMPKLINQLSNHDNLTLKVPVMGILLKESESYTKLNVAHHSSGESKGTQSMVTGYGVPPRQRQLLAGSFMNAGLLVCDLPKDL